MSWQMIAYIVINIVALAYCAVLAVEIVRALRDSENLETARLSLASLLSLSGSLEEVA